VCRPLPLSLLYGSFSSPGVIRVFFPAFTDPPILGFRCPAAQGQPSCLQFFFRGYNIRVRPFPLFSGGPSPNLSPLFFFKYLPPEAEGVFPIFFFPSLARTGNYSRPPLHVLNFAELKSGFFVCEPTDPIPRANAPPRPSFFPRKMVDPLPSMGRSFSPLDVFCSLRSS